MSTVILWKLFEFRLIASTECKGAGRRVQLESLSELREESFSCIIGCKHSGEMSDDSLLLLDKGHIFEHFQLRREGVVQAVDVDSG
jgi:hypothetical protein